MSLNHMLALKSCSTSSEKFSLQSPDLYHQQLQRWTSTEMKKHFYPFHQVSQLWNNPVPLPGSADDPSAYAAARNPVKWWGITSRLRHLRCRKAMSRCRNICWDMENTHHQSKKASMGNLSSYEQQLEEWAQSVGIAASWKHYEPC